MSRVILGKTSVTLYDEAVLFPQPSLGTEGASIAALKGSRGMGQLNLDVAFTADVACTLDPLAIYVVRSGIAYHAGDLNGGAPIAIRGPNCGATFSVACGSDDHIAVGGIGGDVVPTAGAKVTVKITQIEGA